MKYISKRLMAFIVNCILYYVIAHGIIDWLIKPQRGLYQIYELLFDSFVIAITIFTMVKFGGSIGKLLFGLRVIDSTSGNYLTIKKILLRLLPIILMFIGSVLNEYFSRQFSGKVILTREDWAVVLHAVIFIAYMSESVLLFFSSTRQALHDVLASCVVVEKFELSRKGAVIES